MSHWVTDRQDRQETQDTQDTQDTHLLCEPGLPQALRVRDAEQHRLRRLLRLAEAEGGGTGISLG